MEAKLDYRQVGIHSYISRIHPINRKGNYFVLHEDYQSLSNYYAFLP